MGTGTFAEILAEKLEQQAGSSPDGEPTRSAWQAPWRTVSVAWRSQEFSGAMPRPERPAPCLEQLGLSARCSLDDVRRAFRRQALHTHPDRRGGSHQAFVALQRAYDQAVALLELEAA